MHYCTSFDACIAMPSVGGCKSNESTYSNQDILMFYNNIKYNNVQYCNACVQNQHQSVILYILHWIIQFSLPYIIF